MKTTIRIPGAKSDFGRLGSAIIVDGWPGKCVWLVVTKPRANVPTMERVLAPIRVVAGSMDEVTSK